MIAERSAGWIVAKHDPVMLDEVLHVLNLHAGSVVVDGTLGLGGHSSQFVNAVTPGGTVVGFDWDQEMLAQARERLGNPEGVNLYLVHDDFRNIKTQLTSLGLFASAILMDLGLNSAQIEDADRGISFQQDGPLDMRMDRSSGESVASFLNRVSPHEIEKVLALYGDEKWARRIAQKILERRKIEPLRTTKDLVECVLAAIPVAAREKRIHPATRTFQALRIAINGELENLDTALVDAASMLQPGGVLAVLSYHSGEDRIVKHTFRELAEEDEFEDVYRKPLIPSAEEISTNPRSRSAKLRALRRRTG